MRPDRPDTDLLGIGAVVGKTHDSRVRMKCNGLPNIFTGNFRCQNNSKVRVSATYGFYPHLNPALHPIGSSNAQEFEAVPEHVPSVIGQG